MKFKKEQNIFNWILSVSAVIPVVIAIGIFMTLFTGSLPVIKKIGLNFIYSADWDPVNGSFGALPFIVGTILTSVLALLVSTPFSIAIALVLGEYSKGKRLGRWLQSLVEIMAGIPSVIYGFWGLFVLVPLVRKFEMIINAPPYGIGLLTASLILAIMIIPYSASVAREVITMVPQGIKDAAYSLGATRFEVISKVVLPAGKSGIFAGLLLAFGRAIGETMAVTMVIGNFNGMPQDLFSPANTMASLIANEFAEAAGDFYLAALMEIGLLLFVLSTLFNILGKFIIKKSVKQDI